MSKSTIGGFFLSAAIHGAVLGVLWMQPIAVTRPRVAPPVHGEHAVRLVWLPETVKPAPREAVTPEIELSTQAIELPLEAPPEEAAGPPERAPRATALPALPAAPPPLFSDLPERPVDDPLEPPPAVPARMPPSPAVVAGAPPPQPRPTSVEENSAAGVLGVESDAELASEVVPIYPRHCRRRSHEGTVRIEVRVAATGAVLTARVIESAGCHKLDESALDAVRRARYEPARADSYAVPGSVIVPVVFRLR